MTLADARRRHLRRVASARRRRDKADADLRAAITEARDYGGATLQQIADAANVTRQRIHAMLGETR